MFLDTATSKRLWESCRNHHTSESVDGKIFVYDLGDVIRILFLKIGISKAIAAIEASIDKKLRHF